MVDYYKQVIRTASLISCWLLWQPVVMFAYYLCFIVLFNARWQNWLTDYGTEYYFQ